MSSIARDVQFYTEVDIDGVKREILVSIKKAKLEEKTGVFQLKPICVDDIYYEKIIIK
jgi:hypothetical protein